MTPNESSPSQAEETRDAAGQRIEAAGVRLCVDRGPSCLFVKIEESPEETADLNGLSEILWALLQRHLVYRLILDLHDVPLLRSVLLGQLVALRKRIVEHNGSIRLCGLSSTNQQVLHMHKLTGRLPHFASRRDAVMR